MTTHYRYACSMGQGAAIAKTEPGSSPLETHPTPDTSDHSWVSSVAPAHSDLLAANILTPSTHPHISEDVYTHHPAPAQIHRMAQLYSSQPVTSPHLPCSLRPLSLQHIPPASSGMHPTLSLPSNILYEVLVYPHRGKADLKEKLQDALCTLTRTYLQHIRNWVERYMTRYTYLYLGETQKRKIRDTLIEYIHTRIFFLAEGKWVTRDKAMRKDSCCFLCLQNSEP